MAKHEWTYGWARDWVITTVIKWIWGLPFVTALIYAALAFFKGFQSPEIYLGALAAGMMTVVSITAIKGFSAIKGGRDDVADIRTLVAEVSHERAKIEQPVPTVEMLERSRREGLDLIAKWRAMVLEIHAKKQNAKGSRSVRGLIEEHPDYPSLRARISPVAKHVIEGTTQGKAVIAKYEADTASRSTYPVELRVLFDEIARIEAERGANVV